MKESTNKLLLVYGKLTTLISLLGITECLTKEQALGIRKKLREARGLLGDALDDQRQENLH